MCFLVGLARRGVGEGFVAVPTAEGLFSRVNPNVPFEISCVRKFLSAVLEQNTSDSEPSLNDKSLSQIIT